MLLKMAVKREESEEQEITKMENQFKEVGKDLGMDCFNHFKLNRVETYAEVENDKITVEDLNKLVASGYVEIVSL